MCKYLGKGLSVLDFEFSGINDDHFSIATLPESLVELNLNGCREISEKTLVQISKQCMNLKRIGKSS